MSKFRGTEVFTLLFKLLLQLYLLLYMEAVGKFSVAAVYAAVK